MASPTTVPGGTSRRQVPRLQPDTYHLVTRTRAGRIGRFDRTAEAGAPYERAAMLTGNAAEQSLIEAKRRALPGPAER